jgi:hypothetical protein
MATEVFRCPRSGARLLTGGGYISAVWDDPRDEHFIVSEATAGVAFPSVARYAIDSERLPLNT